MWVNAPCYNLLVSKVIISNNSPTNRTPPPHTHSTVGELLQKGMEYIKFVLSSEYRHGGRGTLLICGSSGSEGAGAGKTSLSLLLCKAMTAFPYLAHKSYEDCTSFRGELTELPWLP